MDTSQFKNRKKLLLKEKYTLKKVTRNKIFKILKPIIPILVLILISTILTWVGVFKIKHIEYNNLKYVSEIDTVLNKYKGVGYFNIKVNSFSDDVKESSGYIKEIRVEKMFPNKLRLDIEEHNPKYRYVYKENCYTISEYGAILESSEECAIENLANIESNKKIFDEKSVILSDEIYKSVRLLEEFGWAVSKVEIIDNILKIYDNDKLFIVEVSNDFVDQLAKAYIVLRKAHDDRISFISLDARFQRPVMELL